MPYEPGGSAGELLALLECSGPLTRSNLVRLSGLPRTTVTGMVGDLISRELIVERTAGQADRTTQAGRPPRTLASAAPPTVTAVLSCGRSGIEAALVTYPGQIIARLSSAEVVGYQGADLASIARPVGDLVEELLIGSGCSWDQLGHAVIGLPRPVGPGEAAVAVAERLAVPVHVENDANLGTLGEAAFEPAAGTTASSTSRSATTWGRVSSSGDGCTAAPPGSAANWRTCRCATTAICAAAAVAAAWPRSWGPRCLTTSGCPTRNSSRSRRFSRSRRSATPASAGYSPTSAGWWAGRWPASARCSTRPRWSWTGLWARPASTCWPESGSLSTGTRPPWWPTPSRSSQASSATGRICLAELPSRATSVSPPSAGHDHTGYRVATAA